jgi:hypothetical protein
VANSQANGNGPDGSNGNAGANGTDNANPNANANNGNGGNNGQSGDTGNGNAKSGGPDSDVPTPYPDFVIELLTHGASGTANGAIYSQEDFQPTGTGVFLPFLRIQETGPDKDGVEAGYNTDARPVDLDTKDNNHWTHSLGSETPEVVVSGGTAYIAFRLDVNEQGNSDDRIIWLNKLDVYLGSSPDLTLDSPGGLGQLIYSLDGGPRGNGSVKLDYRLAHGSGSGDMQVLIPKALFAPDKYVYLFSEFSGADAGFEEWSARVAPVQAPPAVPLPAAVWGGVVLLGGLGIGRRLRNRHGRNLEE